ncbi:sulfatase-like hydrolase/transferase [uncultured Lutibacter sp.]|uniref:sulfatase-like hydrolase/transferase n=1 Tax=uncultured Lutibacter sp. TaxID=437739 RepID=UPI002635CE1E|nr:sulfatase-like hydrolase/transferase [uncultured Lutibacter sp.]
MKFKSQAENIYKYIYLTIALICTFWFLSLFEIYINFTNIVKAQDLGHTLLYKLLNDFWSGLIIGLLFLPFYLVIISFFKNFGKVFFYILFTLVVLVQFGLIKYSQTTLLNLGADILGYSFNDVYITVTSSETMSFIYFLPFIIISTIFISVIYILKKYSTHIQLLATVTILIILFGSIKLIFSESSNAVYQNKIYYLAKDIIRFQNEKSELSSLDLYNRNDYPLLKPFKESKDVLSPFFNLNEEKPNIVIIIVEGLGSEFVGENTYGGFTPYLDSLISKSLYWENFVSTTGRTFGVIPSLLGSLPYGETGFLELPKIPSHISLISVLKANSYTTSYYSGDQSSFDKKVNFLEYNGIDHLIDENKFGSEYVKTAGNSGGFSWGYPDAEIFKKTLASLDGKTLPRLDIIMTLTNHEPFSFPLKEEYEVKIDSIINTNQKFKISPEDIIANKDIYTSLYYTDTSIKDFMEAYAKREEYNNTIFIITGDHRLIPISQKDKLCRFHVPLYIFSPMLKKSEKFKSISSHWDVTPSLLSFLMNNFKFNNLEETTWMSQGLDTAKNFRNIHQIPLMRYKGSINDFIYKDYLLSDGELYKINENFGTYKVIEEELLKTVLDSLKEFKKVNAYITQRNKIFPDSLNIYIKPSIEFSAGEIATIKELTQGLNFDQTFKIAREKAFNKERKTARLLCNYILNELPNHADARTLKGRTLAWDGNYTEAEVELLNVIKRSPYYEDSYLALLDLYWWSTQDEKSIDIVKKARENEIQSAAISFKLAKALKRLNNLEGATKLMDSILAIYPENEEFLTFKQSL